MRRGRESDIMGIAFAEIAYLLLFLSVGAAIDRYVAAAELQRQNEALSVSNNQLRIAVADLESEVYQLGQHVAELESDNERLTAELDAKRNAVVACYQRTGVTMEPIVAEVKIRNRFVFEVFSHYPSPDTRTERVFTPDDSEIRATRLTAAIAPLIAVPQSVAARNNCYLRVRVLNDTDSDRLRLEANEVLEKLPHVVVVQ